TWMDHFNIKYEAVPLDATAVGGENQMMFSREHISGHATTPMKGKLTYYELFINWRFENYGN
ncbi:MAG: hypothetical protein ACTSQI_20610, partial [Candidatus Helarchaeota archaeon]